MPKITVLRQRFAVEKSHNTEKHLFSNSPDYLRDEKKELITLAEKYMLTTLAQLYGEEKITEAERKEIDNFLIELVGYGTRPEPIVCAIIAGFKPKDDVDLEQKQSSKPSESMIEQLCAEWLCEIHTLLRFATELLLSQSSKFRTNFWQDCIFRLLDAGALPTRKIALINVPHYFNSLSKDYTAFEFMAPFRESYKNIWNKFWPASITESVREALIKHFSLPQPEIFKILKEVMTNGNVEKLNEYEFAINKFQIECIVYILTDDSILPKRETTLKWFLQKHPVQFQIHIKNPAYYDVAIKIQARNNYISCLDFIKPFLEISNFVNSCLKHNFFTFKGFVIAEDPLFIWLLQRHQDLVHSYLKLNAPTIRKILIKNNDITTLRYILTHKLNSKFFEETKGVIKNLTSPFTKNPLFLLLQEFCPEELDQYFRKNSEFFQPPSLFKLDGESLQYFFERGFVNLLLVFPYAIDKEIEGEFRKINSQFILQQLELILEFICSKTYTFKFGGGTNFNYKGKPCLLPRTLSEFANLIYSKKSEISPHDLFLKIVATARTKANASSIKRCWTAKYIYKGLCERYPSAPIVKFLTEKLTQPRKKDEKVSLTLVHGDELKQAPQQTDHAPLKLKASPNRNSVFGEASRTSEQFDGYDGYELQEIPKGVAPLQG